ncbi:MAG: phosphoenolpyruvate synthase [Candidatus Nealsonbacteria bacterium CG09_land_8_20_14_0_10_42_14]|uniref:Phosphoenolpyruvate synthase n=1 Tax=Candidatus Nealsonbacteria bacterium CG09_land_8_20_14_0_10_42_14 TaxID=1974707 RepID=A0A2H0WZB7_9BACT|nr:MAG: phosphoenolpyruvate synthase [Candidatus Nealsonbacteria bacterium CG09_land_8_20_14_0_10_42_14]
MSYIKQTSNGVKSKKFILWFKDISSRDVPLVGGKNASLGEMQKTLAKKGISVPDGFALTSRAYWHFINKNKLKEKIRNILKGLNINDVKNLQRRGKEIRSLILRASLPENLKKEIKKAYQKLCLKYGQNTDVAVRSSATAEDLPSASFAGQHETFLNVRGEEDLFEACRKCLASLFTDRAISYRQKGGFNHLKIALSIGVQKMVRSDKGSAGVIFTLDTETGFRNVVLITGAFGVGEMVVQGKIIPDEFYVFKPTLKQGFSPLIVKNLGTKRKKLIYGRSGLAQVSIPTEERDKFCLEEKEILALARWAQIIEEHYGRPMDIEWAKDGLSKQLFIVQARPETVHLQKVPTTFKEYTLPGKSHKVLAEGIAVGQKISAGKVRVIKNVKGISGFKPGEILVTPMTDPDWEPIMKKAAGIITDLGGRTSHAAIVSRELGVSCIVGTGRATSILKNGQLITMDCSSGEVGRVYQGRVKWQEKEYNLKKIPKIKTKIMVNIGTPEIAFRNSFLPHRGVGLAREEFIIASKIRVHPLALIKQGKSQQFVDELARGIGQIAAAFWPYPAIVRFSDFKTNEYAALSGGEEFEPREQNPMLGWRGASRYYDAQFKPAFLLECQALKKAREEFGLKNIWAMVPFCRTPEEGKKILKIMKEAGLEKGRDGLKVIVMCEIPSNVVLVEEFLEIFDGMSIGSNDLTQLTLGIDRDSAKISYVGNEQNEAVKKMIAQVIRQCRKRKKYCGICGDAPSSLPGFAEFLVREGIESMSLTPDAVIKTILKIAKVKK